MSSSTTGRFDGFNADVAFKAPCRLKTTGAITLSGLQSIDGVSTATGDRVCVSNQVNTIDNGIWVASTGQWTRAADFDGSYDIAGGTTVRINEGDSNGNTFWYISGNGPLLVGTSPILFFPTVEIFQAGTAVGAWADFESKNIPAGTDLVEVDHTIGAAGGTSNFKLRLDPEQTEFTAQMTALINGAVSQGQTLANAQADMRAWQRRWRKVTANGRWFTNCSTFPDSAMFGTLGDGRQSAANVMSGTDVTENIQDFVDYIIYIRKIAGYFQGDGHRISRCIQLGTGVGFVSGEFYGAGKNLAGSSGFPGTYFVSDVANQPMFNLAGGRNTVFSGCALKGKFGAHMLDNLLGFGATPMGAVDDLLEASWVAPGLPTTQDNRYNPYALFTTGAYAGARQVPTAHGINTPYLARVCVFTGGNVYICTTAGTSAGGTPPTGVGASIVDGGVIWRWLGAYNAGVPHEHTSYPDVPWRRCLTGPSQYNRNQTSSDTVIDRVWFEGGNTGFCSHPSDFNSQGDFPRINNCTFVYNKIPISAGNDQCRNMSIIQSDFALYYKRITNRVHGKQNGAIQVKLEACSGGAGIYLFDLSLSFGAGFTEINGYTESQRRIGIFQPSNPADFGGILMNCKFGCSFIHPTRGRAGRMIHTDTNDSAITSNISGRIKFIGGQVSSDGPFSCMLDGVTFEDTVLYDVTAGLGAVQPYIAHFLNASSGGFIPPSLNYRRQSNRIRWPLYNILTGAFSGLAATTERGYKFGQRIYGIPLAVQSVCASGIGIEEELIVPSTGAYIVPKSIASPVRSGRLITLTVPGVNQAIHADTLGFGPGSACLDTQSETAFAVRSFVDGTDTLILEAQDNIRDPGGGFVFINAPSLTVGSFIFKHGRHYTPPQPIFGDVTSGSATIANCGRSNSSGTTIETDVAVGDYLSANPDLDHMFAETAKVNTRTNGSPGSIVLDQVATRTFANKRLGFFRTPTPANV